MGKVKSAIITTLLVLAILVLALFATISCNVPGSENAKRYNSFITSIGLGSDLSGEAYTLLYPEGVISTADYKLVADDADNENRAEYIEKYELRDGVYVEKDKLADESFVESIRKDAEIISERFGKKGYTKYSVSVEDECKYVIKVSVPTGFSYSAYKSFDNTSRSNALSAISHTVQYLSLNGEISLRNADSYDSSKSLLSIKEDFADYFKGVSYYAMGGNHAVRMSLTNDGFSKLNTVLLLTSSSDGDSSSSSSAYIYVGETNLNLTIPTGEALENKTLYFQSDANYATDFAILLDSVVKGNILTNSFNTDKAGSGTQIIVATPTFGEYSAIYVFVALILALVATIVASAVKYKKLGLVHALIALVYALVIVTAMLLLNIQLTIGGAFIIVLGLALLTFSNFRVFESVRAETLSGRTIVASVKSGYKKTISSILDLHIILIVISAMLALICTGELACCGFIMFIASVASYILYWFTRFMWYVISSPVKDKFKFCGYSREVRDDEE